MFYTVHEEKPSFVDPFIDGFFISTVLNID